MSEYRKMRPSEVCRPRLVKDGDQWCALYGVDLQVGVAGFGSTKEEALAAFDEAWAKRGITPDTAASLFQEPPLHQRQQPRNR